MRPHSPDWRVLTRAAFVWFLFISAAVVVLVLVRGPLWIAYLQFPSAIVLLVLLWLEHRRAGARSIGGPRQVPQDGSFANNPIVKLIVIIVAAVIGMLLARY